MGKKTAVEPLEPLIEHRTLSCGMKVWGGGRTPAATPLNLGLMGGEWRDEDIWSEHLPGVGVILRVRSQHFPDTRPCQRAEVDRWWGVRAALRGLSIINLNEHRQKRSIGSYSRWEREVFCRNDQTAIFPWKN